MINNDLVKFALFEEYDVGISIYFDIILNGKIKFKNVINTRPNCLKN